MRRRAPRGSPQTHGSCGEGDKHTGYGLQAATSGQCHSDIPSALQRYSCVSRGTRRGCAGDHNVPSVTLNLPMKTCRQRDRPVRDTRMASRVLEPPEHQKYFRVKWAWRCRGGDRCKVSCMLNIHGVPRGWLSAECCASNEYQTANQLYPVGASLLLMHYSHKGNIGLFSSTITRLAYAYLDT